jgi:hypothetical protein
MTDPGRYRIGELSSKGDCICVRCGNVIATKEIVVVTANNEKWHDACWHREMKM